MKANFDGFAASVIADCDAGLAASIVERVAILYLNGHRPQAFDRAQVVRLVELQQRFGSGLLSEYERVQGLWRR